MGRHIWDWDVWGCLPTSTQPPPLQQHLGAWLHLGREHRSRHHQMLMFSHLGTSSREDIHSVRLELWQHTLHTVNSPTEVVEKRVPGGLFYQLFSQVPVVHMAGCIEEEKVGQGWFWEPKGIASESRATESPAVHRCKGLVLETPQKLEMSSS